MRLLFAVIAVIPAFAQPTITCPAAVNQGAVVTCTSSAPVSWSLSGAGNLSPVDSTHATYIAPSHVTPQQQWGGCQELPNDHIYNTRIDGLLVDPNSVTYISNGPAHVSGGPPGDFGFNSVAAGSPTQSMAFLYTTDNAGTFYFPTRPNLKIENGMDTPFVNNVDRHMITVAHDTCQEQEIYNPYPEKLQVSCPTCTAQGGVSYSLNSYALPTTGTTDAAGMLLGPATYKKAEIMAGSINHAGRFTMAPGYMSNTYRWPAQSSTGGVCSTCVWPMGARVRLKASFNVSSLASPYARAMATAWQQYGMILADIGTDWQFQLEQESYPQAVVDGFRELSSAIDNTSFEVVDESPLMVSSSSGLTTSPGVAITGTQASGPAGTATIALTGVTMGTDSPSLTVQAGSAAFQVNVWVNGSNNIGITWALEGDGSLSSSGVYTPPFAEGAATTTTITATSVADPTVSVTIPITLLPGGAIRVNTGDSADFTDSLGNLWYGDFQALHPIISLVESPYQQDTGGGNWDTADNIALLSRTHGGADAMYPIHVPNGNYQVQFLTGATTSEVAGNRCTDYEAQGVIASHGYDVVARTGLKLTGTTVTIPAQVTDGVLTVAARTGTCPSNASVYSAWTSPIYTASYAPLLGAFSVIPDANPPHITIDNPLAIGQKLSLGKTLHLYAIGWYMDSSVTWAVTSGDGSIDANGVYTAPSTPHTEVVTITATSTVDGSQTATTTIPLVFGTIAIIPISPQVTRTMTDQMKAVIDGVPYPNVTWYLVSGPGSISFSGLYTAPAALLTDTSVTIRATSTDNPSHYGEIAIPVTRLLASLRVNCGDAGAFMDSAGKTWSVDPGMGGDAVVRYSYRNVSVANTTPDMQPLYNSATYGQGDSYYLYSVPNSRYRVTLKFADYGNLPAGSYLSSWRINGTTVLNNFDLASAAGGPLSAVDRSFVVVVTNGTLKIEGSAQNGKQMQLNGFAIDDLGPSISVQISGKTERSGRTD